MTKPFSSPISGFAAFLPPEYRGDFSPEWLAGLSPFTDNTCAGCYAVQGGEWVSFGGKPIEELSLACERVAQPSGRRTH